MATLLCFEKGRVGSQNDQSSLRRLLPNGIGGSRQMWTAERRIFKPRWEPVGDVGLGPEFPADEQTEKNDRREDDETRESASRRRRDVVTGGSRG
jgi:hypothetical protein